MIKQPGFILLLLFMVTLTSSASIAAENPENLLEIGTREFARGNYSEADAAFSAYIKANPSNPDAMALRGMVRYHLGRYADSAIDIEYAVAHRTKYMTRSLYYLGLAYSRLGRQADAEKTYTRLFKEFPDSPEARKLGYKPPDKEIQVKGTQNKSKLLDIILLQEFNYDSNADRDATGTEDYVFYSFFYARYKTPGLPLNLKTYGFWNNYYEQDSLDISGIAGGPELDIDLTEADNFKLDFSLLKIWIDRREYSNKFSSSATWKHDWSGQWYSDLRLKVGQKSYQNIEYENLDGNQYRGRVRLWVYPKGLAPIERIRIFGEVLKEFSEEDYLGYTGGMAGFETRFRLAEKLKLDTEIYYENRLYDEVNPDYGVTRGEYRFKAEFELSLELTETLSAWVKTEYLYSNSNISFYEYDQLVSGMGFMLFF